VTVVRQRTSLLSTADPGSFDTAVGALRAGEVIALPTDTVYGLGAHGLLPQAIAQLFVLKGREWMKPIPLLIGQMDDLCVVASEVPEIAWRLAQRFWPGPVTLVVPCASTLPVMLTSGGSSVAVRMPAHDAALRLISELGAPVAATSANLSGGTDAVTAQEVETIFGGRVRIILDGGRCPGGVPSTIVDLTAEPVVIRRRGTLAAAVEDFLTQAQ